MHGRRNPAGLGTDDIVGYRVIDSKTKAPLSRMFTLFGEAEAAVHGIRKREPCTECAAAAAEPCVDVATGALHGSRGSGCEISTVKKVDPNSLKGR